MGSSGGTLVGLCPPSYAVMSGLSYLPSRNIANLLPAQLHKLRADMYATSTGSLRHWAVIGDSIAGGYNGNGFTNDPEQAFPAQLLRFLVQDYPGMVHGGVGARPVIAGAGAWAAGYVTTGGFSNVLGPWGYTSSGGTITYTSPQVHTSLSVIFAGTSSAFTVKVGAAAAVPVTPSGSGVWDTFTLTGQTIPVGTQILITAGTVLQIAGLCLLNTSGLVIHNLGLGGGRLNSGGNTINWSDYSQITNMAPARMALLPSGITAAFVEAGGNDANNGVPAATAIAGVGNILARPQLAGAVPVEMMSWQIATTPAGLWNQYGAAFYADTAARGAHLIDWNDRVQGQAAAAADGVLGPDGVHPTYALSQGLGKSVADAYLS